MTSDLLKVTTWNVASLRAAWDHDLPHYIEISKPDIFCVQETKLHIDTKPHIDSFKLPGYNGYFFHSMKKGYSGTAIYTKIKPISVKPSFNDEEGRAITMEFSNFYLVNTYVVNAGENLKRLDYKMQIFMPKLQSHLHELAKKKPVFWTGDINIAHNPIDIWKTEGHEEIAGFTPVERKWLSEFLQEGYIDCFRHFHPDIQEFSFFNFRGQSKLKNQGWRIDYFITQTQTIEQLGVSDCTIEKGIDGSDHQPVSIFMSREKALSPNDALVEKQKVELLSFTTTTKLDSFFAKKN